jgi:NitT/TauT family transport system substrate-binding protein
MARTPQRFLFKIWRSCALLGIIALLGPVAACHRPAPVPSNPISLATYEWPGSFWVNLAADKGWFAEAGLDVRVIDVNQKYFKSLDDVALGNIDGMGFSQYDLVQHVAAGNDLVGVAAIDYSEGAEALIARPDIHTLHDLKGKRLALTRNTYLEYLLSVVAEREGFNVGDITLLDRSQEEALADFQAGRADAVFLWEPQSAAALKSGGRSLFSTRDFPGLTYSVLTFRREFVNEHPREIAALMQVWHRAERYTREHPDEVCALIARSVNEPLADVRRLYDTDRILDLADNGRAFSYAAGFESLHGSWRRMNDFMIERGLVAHRINSASHLDARFVRSFD